MSKPCTTGCKDKSFVGQATNASNIYNASQLSKLDPVQSAEYVKQTQILAKKLAARR